MRRNREPPSGPVTRAEFAALAARVEDIEETLALRAAAAQYDDRDTLRVELVNRIQSGEHPMRVWRERRGLTLSALAEKCGLRVGYLSEIETGKKSGSVDAHRKAAAALDAVIDDMFPARRGRSLRP